MSRRSPILVPPEQPPGGDGRIVGVWRLFDPGTPDGLWVTLDPQSDGETDAQDSATESMKGVVEAVKRRGFRQSLVLAVPGGWCLSATIPTAGLARHDHKAMLYRLEERLPLPAESLAADFVLSPSGAHALGIAVQVDAVRPIVEALEQAGIVVGIVTPLPLLVAAGVPVSADVSGTRIVTYTVERSSSADLVALQGRTPVAWVRSPATATGAEQRIGWLETSLVAPLTIERLGPALRPGPKRTGDRWDHAKTHAITDAAAASNALDTAARSGTLVDLRRDGLAPSDRWRPLAGSLRAVAAASILLLLSVTAIALLRGERYASAAAEANESALSAVRTAYGPSAGTDEQIRTRLAQERRSWANQQASGGRTFDASRPPARGAGGIGPALAGASALRTLRDVVKLIPDGVDVRIESTMFSDTTFELTGRGRSYEEIDRFTAALRAGHPDVSLSQARRSPDGHWNFTLRGTAATATAAR